MAVTPIVGTLGYLWDRAADTVLLVRRSARPDDDQFGKVNGLGGKLERDESVVDCLRRELREEAAVELVDFALRGTITWSNFGPKREDWLGFIYVITEWSGSPPASNDEGDLFWAPRADLLQACADQGAEHQLSLWAGDRHFLPLVFDDDPLPFHGTMPYDGDRPLSWSFERC